MKKIIIVEDDEVIAKELRELLNHAGYNAILLEDFENPKKELEEVKADLILLDINIPYHNGEFLLQEFRKESNTPVVMVTSRNSETDELLSMSFGADDYITKPYNPNILLLRIAAILKRIENSDNNISYRDLEISMQRGIIKKGEIEVILTKNEMIIFYYLLTHQNRIVTRDELMTTLWNNNEYINDNALTVNISRLRAKLKEIGEEDAIVTRKGIGYILS